MIQYIHFALLSQCILNIPTHLPVPPSWFDSSRQVLHTFHSFYSVRSFLWNGSKNAGDCNFLWYFYFSQPKSLVTLTIYATFLWASNSNRVRHSFGNVWYLYAIVQNLSELPISETIYRFECVTQCEAKYEDTHKNIIHCFCLVRWISVTAQILHIYVDLFNFIASVQN